MLAQRANTQLLFWVQQSCQPHSTNEVHLCKLAFTKFMVLVF